VARKNREHREYDADDHSTRKSKLGVCARKHVPHSFLRHSRISLLHRDCSLRSSRRSAEFRYGWLLFRSISEFERRRQPSSFDGQKLNQSRAASCAAGFCRYAELTFLAMTYSDTLAECRFGVRLCVMLRDKLSVASIFVYGSLFWRCHGNFSFP
jgi:hypothetical protein